MLHPVTRKLGPFANGYKRQRADYCAFIAIVIRNFNNAVSVFSVPVYYAFYCTLQRIQSKSLPHVPWPFYHIWRCEAKPF